MVCFHIKLAAKIATLHLEAGGLANSGRDFDSQHLDSTFLGEKFNIFSFVFFYLMFAIVFLVVWLGLGTNMFTFISPSQD